MTEKKKTGRPRKPKTIELAAAAKLKAANNEYYTWETTLDLLKKWNASFTDFQSWLSQKTGYGPTLLGQWINWPSLPNDPRTLALVLMVLSENNHLLDIDYRSTIKALRSAGWSRSRLYVVSGLWIATLIRLEAGKKPKVSSAEKIIATCAKLGVQVRYFNEKKE